MVLARTCSKAKNARTKRVLDDRAPKVIENPKSAVFVRGNKTGQTVDTLLHDLVCACGFFLLAQKFPHCLRFFFHGAGCAEGSMLMPPETVCARD